MAKKSQDVRPIIKLRSTAGTGFTYVTKKNRRNTPDRLELKKYCSTCASSTVHRETR